jgi:hypothetical protein
VPSEQEQLAEVEAIFADRGFLLVVEARDNTAILSKEVVTRSDEFWVDLVSQRTGEVVVPNYGSGPSRTTAIISAEQRWLVEQDGTVHSNGRTYVEMGQDRLQKGRNS